MRGNRAGLLRHSKPVSASVINAFARSRARDSPPPPPPLRRASTRACQVAEGRSSATAAHNREPLPRCPFRKSYASTFERGQRVELGHCHVMLGPLSLVIRSSIMPVPLAPQVILADDEQSRL